jgi:hypothetical protein
MGADGLGLISYLDFSISHDLKLAQCSNVECSAAKILTIDAADAVGDVSSVTIGIDGSALISYFDQSIGWVKVAHCANQLCLPYFRRR